MAALASFSIVPFNAACSALSFRWPLSSKASPPRATATCEIADLHLPISSGADVALFSYERILASGGVALAQDPASGLLNELLIGAYKQELQLYSRRT